MVNNPANLAGEVDPNVTPTRTDLANRQATGAVPRWEVFA
jgi:hypothetical protein